jgi:hypothetical protein
MTWFAAHLILYIKFKQGSQEHFPVWENVVLIKAESEEEAFAKAEQRGREEEGDDDGTLRWGERPATWVFAGVRKLTACQDAEKRPGDGSEITYLELDVDSLAAVEQLAAGQPVAVRYQDRFPATNGEGVTPGKRT